MNTENKKNIKETLVNLSFIFIDLIIHFKTHSTKLSRVEMKNKLAIEMTAFEEACLKAGFSKEIFYQAQYCLCAAMDETISLSEWGKIQHWAHHGLLGALLNETDAGEGFYKILDRAMLHPEANKPLLELIYVLLSLGYEGKYYLLEKTAMLSLKENLLSAFSTPQNQEFTHAAFEVPRQPSEKIKIYFFLALACFFILSIFIFLNYYKYNLITSELTHYIK